MMSRDAMSFRTLRLCSVVLSVGVLSSCATPGGQGPQASGAPQCFFETMGASLLCGAVADGNNRVRAALVCAAAAYVGCQFAKSYTAQRVQTEQEVKAGYVKANKQLPPAPMVTAFSTQLSPDGRVRKQAALDVTSDLTVVPGRSGGPVKIEHEVAIVDKYGTEWFKGKRQPNQGEAGTYQTAFNMTVPKEMEPGDYRLQQAVYLNGAPSGSALISPKQFRVLAAVDGEPVQVAWLD